MITYDPNAALYFTATPNSVSVLNFTLIVLFGWLVTPHIVLKLKTIFLLKLFPSKKIKMLYQGMFVFWLAFIHLVVIIILDYVT